jgi:uncharacterized protein YeaO (DUF488 family)
MIRTKRVYVKPGKDDGFRLLVDRLWPRGLAKERAAVDMWMKEIAPSDALRKWFGHEPEKWPEFEKRYRKELAVKKDLLSDIHELESEHKLVTLLYGRNDETQNQAVILADVLKRKR